jgi:hypothetical protein
MVLLLEGVELREPRVGEHRLLLRSTALWTRVAKGTAGL